MKELLKQIGEVPNWKLPDQIEYFKKLGLEPIIQYIDGEEMLCMSTPDLNKLIDMKIKYAEDSQDLCKLTEFKNFVNDPNKNLS